MNDDLSPAVCEFHVQAIGTLFWCHHANTPSKIKNVETKEFTDDVSEAAPMPDVRW
jgi:hypothetical protein